MNDLIKIFTKNYGYARMKMLKEAGIHTRTVALACSEGIIEKIKPGLYRLTAFPRDENDGFVLISQAYPGAVVCLVSAAEYYNFTDVIPSEISFAVPHSSSRIKIHYPPVKVYFFNEEQYAEEIKVITTGNGSFKIYSPEKTITDLFRYRNKIGDDIFYECLKNYLKTNKNNTTRLISCAQKFRLTGKILPVIRAMVV